MGSTLELSCDIFVLEGGIAFYLGGKYFIYILYTYYIL